MSQQLPQYDPGGELPREAIRLLQAHESKVKQWLVSLGVDGSSVDDVYQEVAIGLLKHIANHGSLPEQFRSWLFRVASNQRDQFFRDRGQEPSANAEDIDTAPLSDQTAEPLEPLIECEDREAVCGAVREEVAKLADRYRDVLVLRFFEGLTYEEIAERLGRPLGTISIQLSRAKSKLQESLKKRLDIPETKIVK